VRRCPPFDTLHVEQVPGENGLVLEQVEAITREPPAVSDQHALGAALWNFDLGRDRVRAIEDLRRRIAELEKSNRRISELEKTRTSVGG
jgi:hypothetical protein